MSRGFAGADLIDFSSGGMSGVSGPFTCVAILNRTAGGNNCFASINSGTTRRSEFKINGANQLQWTSPGINDLAVTSITIPATDGWVLVAITKASGTSVVRGHKFLYSSSVWQHANSTATAGNPTAGTSIRLGAIATPSDYFIGNIAVVGMWSRVLTDAEIEGLASSIGAWSALSPAALWKLDQASTATAVPDMTTGGANQTAITGTSVSTSDPPGFSYATSISRRGGSSATVTVTATGAGRKRTGTGSTTATSVTAGAAGRKLAGGGSTASVNASTAGSGSRSARGGSTSSTTITSSGNGRKTTRVGSTAPVLVDAAGAGGKVARGGSTAATSTTAAGVGRKATGGGSAPGPVAVTAGGSGTRTGRGGSAATVVVTASGGGHPVTAGRGGSTAGIAVTASGTGRKATRGGSGAAIIITAEAAGQKVARGASTAGVAAAADAIGRAEHHGGSTAQVTISVLSQPIERRDLNLVSGPESPRRWRPGQTGPRGWRTSSGDQRWTGVR